MWSFTKVICTLGQTLFHVIIIKMSIVVQYNLRAMLIAFHNEQTIIITNLVEKTYVRVIISDNDDIQRTCSH